MKEKKETKKNKGQAKETAKLYFKSLYSNDACVEGGRKKKWYLAVPTFILAVMIAVIPVTVSIAKSAGSSFMSGAWNYGFDLAAQRFSEALLENDIGMVVKSETVKKNKEHRYLAVDEDAWARAFGDNSFPGPHFVHTNVKGDPDLEVYYTRTDDLKSFLNMIRTEAIVDEDTKEMTFVQRNVSYVVFHRDKVVASFYKPGLAGGNPVSNFNGDYEALAVDYDIRNTGVVTAGDGTILDQSFFDDEGKVRKYYNVYRDGVFANWKAFFDDSYLTLKNTALWQQSLLMLAINIALTLFMGLMIYILTRGKHNPFRTYTFWESQKIAYWCTLTPAVLALIMGFIFPSYALIMFPMFLGVRVMWLSMKTLRPEPVPSAREPVKKAPPKEKVVKVKPQKGEKKHWWSLPKKAKKGEKEVVNPQALEPMVKGEGEVREIPSGDIKDKPKGK